MPDHDEVLVSVARQEERVDLPWKINQHSASAIVLSLPLSLSLSSVCLSPKPGARVSTVGVFVGNPLAANRLCLKCKVVNGEPAHTTGTC